MTSSVWGDISVGAGVPSRFIFAVNTITDLRAISAPVSTANVTIAVDGGAAKGDKAEGIFYYDPLSVLVDNGFSIIIPNSAPAAGRWVRLTYPGILSINTTPVGNIGAGTDDLMSYSILANTLSKIGTRLKFKAWGTTANNANPKNCFITFGALTVFSESFQISVDGRWVIEGEIIKTGINTQEIQSIMHNVLASVLNPGNQRQDILSGVEVDTAAILLRFQASATADNDVIQRGLIVERN